MRDTPKNYIGFSNDASGSMSTLANAAIRDYNTNIGAIKAASTAKMMDTIVSSNNFESIVTREIILSNPHVLVPMTRWPSGGLTALYDGIGDMIELFKAVPDYDRPGVSFLVIATTDGGENASVNWNESKLAEEIKALQKTGRWTFVLRVPRNQSHAVRGLGIPAGNIQEWDTTTAGMTKSTEATTAAVEGYFSTRAAGQSSSTVFYAQATAVDTSALVDITKEVSLYVVPHEAETIEIRPFILRHRMEYLKGSAFYQLTKTESKVQPTKMIAVRDRTTGKIYAGKEARQMLGLPTDRNVRLHPGDHGNFDLFIQSSSVNRHLVGGTGVLYWKAIGVPFTEADLAYLQPKPVAPAVVQLPAVVPTNKPTPSPLKAKVAAPVAPVPAQYAPAHGIAPSKPKAIFTGNERIRFHLAPAGAQFFTIRDDARFVASLSKGKLKQYDQGPGFAKGKRYYVA